MARNVNEIKARNIVFLRLKTHKIEYPFLFKLSLNSVLSGWRPES